MFSMLPFEAAEIKNTNVNQNTSVTNAVTEKSLKKSTVKSSTDTNTTKKSTTAAKTRINIVGCSGDAFYNENISKPIKDVVTESGYEFIQYKNTCAGDGSVSLGQAVIAALHYRNNM